MFPVEELSVPGFLLVIPALKYYYKGREAIVLLMFASPSVIMLGMHALVTVNVSRYNDTLLLVYAATSATIMSLILHRIVAKLRDRALSD